MRDHSLCLSNQKLFSFRLFVKDSGGRHTTPSYYIGLKLRQVCKILYLRPLPRLCRDCSSYVFEEFG